MIDGWTTPAAVVGLWGALASTAAAIIAWLVFGRQRKADLPVVTCEIEARDDPTWLILAIGIRNLSPTRWKASRLRLVRPKGALGVVASRATIETGRGGRLFDDATARAKLAEDVPLNVPVDAAGTPRHRVLGGGDQAGVRIYLLRPSSRSTMLSMRLSLVSMDAVQRTIVIAIKRELPPAKIAAKD